MKRPDIPKHFRMAALQCNFEGGRDKTLGVPAKWNDFGFNYEQLFHTHAELYSAIFEKEKHGELLTEYLKQEKENDIDVILYMNCHILLESQRSKFGEWAVVNKDGSYKLLYGTYGACCLNSSWVDFFLAKLETLKGYNIKGIFFDGPVKLQCFCPRCDKKFKAKYKISIHDASSEQLKEFSIDTFVETKKVFYNKVKAINPEWAAYFNEHLLYAQNTVERMKEELSYNDIVGTEGGFQFYLSAKQANLWRCGVCAKMGEAVADGKPSVIFMAGDQKVWSWFLHSPAETKLTYMSAIGNGASVWYGIHCSTETLNGVSGSAAKDVITFDKKNDAVYQNTKCNSDIALFHSLETNRIYTSGSEATDLYADGRKTIEMFIGNYTDSFNGAVDILFKSNLSFDIICELNIDDLSRYNVLLLPTYACMTEEIAEKIKVFVRNGGTLISDSETGLYDTDKSRRSNFLLSDVFGVDFIGSYSRYKPHDYFQVPGTLGLEKSDGVRFIPAPLVTLDLLVHEDSDVVGRLCPSLNGCYAGMPENGKYPFLIKNKYGKGVSFYFSGTFFELYSKHSLPVHRKLFNNILREHAELDFILENAPESVDFTIRKNLDSKEIIFHVLNYTGGMSRPIDRIVPVSGLRIKTTQKFSSIKALRCGKELSQKGAFIELPLLDDFEVIIAK